MLVYFPAISYILQPIWYNLRPFGILYGHLVYFMAIGILYGHVVSFVVIFYLVLVYCIKPNWQPCWLAPSLSISFDCQFQWLQCKVSARCLSLTLIISRKLPRDININRRQTSHCQPVKIVSSPPPSFFVF
jgi:hypothetical protein